MSEARSSQADPAEGFGPPEGMAEPQPERHANSGEKVAAADDSIWGLSGSDRLLLILFALASLLLLAAHAVRLAGRGSETVVIERLPAVELEFQIDVNRATWVEWMQLEGIGETLARRIVADRETRGPFSTVDDLQRVKGIGPATLSRIRAHLQCGPVSRPRED